MTGTKIFLKGAVGYGPDTLPFAIKPASSKLKAIAQNFGFSIAANVLEDHDFLGALRWDAQTLLGSANPHITRALTRLYFEYTRSGRAFIVNAKEVSRFLESLQKDYGSYGNVEEGSRTSIGHIERVDADEASDLISRYHFLGYGRSQSIAIGGFSERGGPLLAVATLSPWDIAHALPALAANKLRASDTWVLSRLLILPGRRVTLSQFLAQIFRWTARNIRSAAAIATYCNPNAGHYGTVYRGANFLPLCFEEHPFIAFKGEHYQSPRQIAHLVGELGPDAAGSLLAASTVRPLPLLLYWHPLRRKQKAGDVGVGGFKHPYAIELKPPTAAKARRKPRRPKFAAPAETLVEVDEDRCRFVGQILASVQLPEKIIQQDQVSGATAGNFNLFLVSICHQTQKFFGAVEGQPLKGWDYLEAVLAEAWRQQNSLTEIATWKRLTRGSFRQLLRLDRTQIGDSDIDARLQLVHGIAADFVAAGFLSFDDLCRAKDWRCQGLNSIFAFLKTLKAFSDPEEKKLRLLIGLLRDAHGWTFRDAHLVSAPVDYHEIRGHLRLGTVKVSRNDAFTGDKAQLAALDARVRQAIATAIGVVAAESGRFDALQTHYILWTFFREVCRRASPACISPDRGVFSARLPEHHKALLTAIVSRQGACVCRFHRRCHAWETNTFPEEYTYRGDYY